MRFSVRKHDPRTHIHTHVALSLLIFFFFNATRTSRVILFFSLPFARTAPRKTRRSQFAIMPERFRPTRQVSTTRWEFFRRPPPPWKLSIARTNSITSSPTADCIRTIPRCITVKGRYPSAFSFASTSSLTFIPRSRPLSPLSAIPASQLSRTEQPGRRIELIRLCPMSYPVSLQSRPRTRNGKRVVVSTKLLVGEYLMTGRSGAASLMDNAFTCR